MTRHPVDLTPKMHHPDDKAIEAIPKLLFPFRRNLLLGAYPDSRVPDLLLLIGHIFSNFSIALLTIHFEHASAA
jgi:hypothetical protein